MEHPSEQFSRLTPDDGRARVAADLIERLRTRLLDLTSRNPLLNYRHSDRARAQVRVIDELPDVLFARLAEGRSMTFRAVDEPDDVPGDERTDDFQIALESARLSDPEYLQEVEGLPDEDRQSPTLLRLERELRNRVRTGLGLAPRPSRRLISVAEQARAQGLDPNYDLPRPEPIIEARHEDDEIQTLLFPDRMEARLSALREGARRALEETGINTCFAAYGFLEWYESVDSEKPLYAPLLLQALEIDRVSHRGRWRYFVKGADEEPTINVTLAERMKEDFGFDWPGLAEGDLPEAYLAKVAALVADQSRWRI
jgi:hypothetical protein